MYALSITVLCSFLVLGTARERSYSSKCCENIRGFKECKRECGKAWTEQDSGTKLQLALSLPKVCPSHLVSLWKCLNLSIKGLHLYTHENLLKHKSCCLLGIKTSCRQACFLSNDRKHLQQSCQPKEEVSLLRCIERNDASKKCCQTNYRKCERACQNVFASNRVPGVKKIRNVRKNCKKRNRHVYKCVMNITSLSKPPGHKCCRKAQNKQCRDVCKEVMASKHPLHEKVAILKKSCVIKFYDELWTCFLTYSKPAIAVPQIEMGESFQRVQPHRVDVRLHCCLSAKNDKCFELCLNTYSDNRESDVNFKRRCEFDPQESSMMTCIADVSHPCHIGCSGLGFCKNFNHRHTELFRSCTKKSDRAAKSDYENWKEKKRVEIHSMMDVIPVKDISTCLPEWWKAVACTLQIRPCHAKSHGSTICRSDCIKILGECAEKEKLGVRTVEDICKKLSPDDQSSCISLEDYLESGSYKNGTNVTHPCYPNPCSKKQGVCEINREMSTKSGNKSSVPYRCTPGCPIDHESNTVIKNGDFARLPVPIIQPITQNSKREGCFKICRCEQNGLSSCTTLPSCVERKPCYLKLPNKTYQHQETFEMDCNFCVCFDGKFLCSKSQCLPGASNNSTDRLRRNHLPNGETTISGLSCPCHGKYDPVCGANGKTYRNMCFASCSGLSNKQESGQCSSRNPCQPSPCEDDRLCVVDRKVCVGSVSACPQYLCIQRPRNCTNSARQLLCDTENKQHVSRCSVQIHEKEVAYAGKCKASCAPGVQEVCGVDGQTYSSVCALEYARMLMDYEGPCTTVGKYGNEKPTIRCAYVKCPKLNPAHCDGVTPPGACCPVCATQMTVLFDEEAVSNTNAIVMDTSQPITQRQVVSRVRRHLSVSQCDIFGFYSTDRDFILLVKTITEKPTELQFLICKKEAQKIETLINTGSPIFSSDEILSSFRAVTLSTPQLSNRLIKPNGKSTLSSSCSTLVLLVCTLLTLILSRGR